ncbi:hypothetical protein [Sandarakinorhabdus sp. DWP1-3-1]|uniref:hypothetical protein n=1 Tax=Sandarakinorhabdus sp. DWP1-3-1 TaxID=2804627 RepID=UPI003CF51E03
MLGIVVVLMVGANVAIGAWLGLQYLKKAPRQRVLVGFHLILGLSMLEVLAAMLRGTPDGAVVSARTLAIAAAGLIAAAVLSGLVAPLVGQARPKVIGPSLAVHAGIATTAFVTLLAWAVTAYSA